MSNDVMNFDLELLRQLRNECEIHCVDTSRAQLIESGGKWSVRFGAPVVDLGTVLSGVPSTLSARSGAQAEGLMLTWLKRIQVAERQVVRVGVCGWDSCAINRRPLSEDEIAAYRVRIKQAEEIAKLQRELTELIETKARSAAERKVHAELEARYGVTTVQPDPMCPTMPNAPAKRTVRKLK